MNTLLIVAIVIAIIAVVYYMTKSSNTQPDAVNVDSTRLQLNPNRLYIFYDNGTTDIGVYKVPGVWDVNKDDKKIVRVYAHMNNSLTGITKFTVLGKNRTFVIKNGDKIDLTAETSTDFNDIFNTDEPLRIRYSTLL